MIPNRQGRVVLVGAGPGDPGLVSVKGLAALRRADAIYYDRLVSPALLGEAPLWAERIYVGKSRNEAAMSQREIEASLIASARAGYRVVRLKGGDPFLFGRGGEEALALQRAGIPYEVIPGVTSALGAPAYAGIPVTHRGLSEGVAIWTASRAEGDSPPPIDAPTQVILMGVHTLERTVEALLARGRPADTPVVIIVWGTTGRQRVVRGRLADIVGRAEREGVTSPAIILVGAVAALSDELHGWTPQGPWEGRRVVVTRPLAGEEDPLVVSLEEAGAEVVVLPLYTWMPNIGALEALLERFERLRSLHFADVAAVDLALQHLFARGYDARALGRTEVTAANEATVTALRRFGLLARRESRPVACGRAAGRPHAWRRGEAWGVFGNPWDRWGDDVVLATGAWEEPEAERQVIRIGELLPVRQTLRTLIDLGRAQMIDAVIVDTPEAEALLAPANSALADGAAAPEDVEAALAEVELVRLQPERARRVDVEWRTV